MARTAFKKNMLVGCILAVALLIWFLGSAPAQAQSVGANLSGTITDSSGAAIAGATITVTNVATGVSATVTTNADGIYNSRNLLPGNYQVAISAQGFEKTVQNGVVLTVGAQQVLNVSLKVGSATQTVSVSAEAATDVQLASSAIGGEVTPNSIVQLPLNGRSWTDLATLQPGVSTIRQMVSVTSADRLGRGLGEELSITGGRPQQNNYLLDGTSINDFSGQAPGSILGGNLGVDAVSEFKVLTTNYSTEYGRTSGGVISAITKSGTNQFHGSAYEFLRNSALDARNFFDGATIPEFRRNQFGASAGGPIQKDKTFIFGDYEGLRQNLGLSEQDQVPSLAIRGIGTGPGGTAGPSLVCSNPAGADPSSPCTTQTLAAYAALNGFTVPNPDPVTGIDQAVLPYLGFYPLPNGPVIGNGDSANFSFGGAEITSENFFTTRLDHQFSSKDSLAGIYLIDNAPSSQNDEFNNKLILSETRRQVATLEETHIFSGTLVNTFRFGYSRIVAGSPSGVVAINPLAANTSIGFLPGNTSGGILGVPGLTDFTGGLSTATPASFHWNSYQFYDNVSLTKGIHALTLGFNVERIQDIESGCGNCGGNYTFNSIPEFLGNQPLTLVSQINPTTNHNWMTIFGAFLQDDIRLRSNLTINAGLRYEMATVPSEANGQVGSLHSLDGAQMFNGNPLFHNPSLRDFEPRVGFAWDPFRTGKTSIRGGFGMFDVQIFPANLRSGIGGYPFVTSLNGSNLAPGSFPTGAVASLSAGPGTTAQRGTFIQQNPGRNYVMQWNADIQREIAPNTTVMLAYVASRGIHNLLVTDDSSIVLPLEKSAEGYLWPIPNPVNPLPVLNPNWGRVSTSFWTSDSYFHAFEASLTQRLNHGLEAQVSYTRGSSIDTSSGSTDGDQFLNGLSSLPFFSETLRKGPSDFNVPNNFTASYTWDIPSPKGLTGALGWVSSGWQFGGILAAQNGTPFTPIIGGDPLGINSTDPFDFPNLVRGCNPAHGGVNYLNVNCFSLPVATPDIAAMCSPFGAAAGQPIAGTCANLVGNGGRNSVVGPRLVEFDTSLFKNNRIKRISEDFNVQFRVEIFNIFNHTNFNAPTANNAIFDQNGVPVGGAGVATATATTSRQIQFALKLVW